MPEPIARWNAARDVWETGTTGLFCEHSDVFLGTFPASGMTRSGVAYPLPPWDAHTSGGGSSSLLPTPTVGNATGGNRARSGDRSNELLLPGVAKSLLPTPKTSDVKGAGVHGDGGLDLRTAATSLLPTPTSTNSQGNAYNNQGKLLLPGVALELSSMAAVSIGETTDPPSDSTSD